MCLKKSIWMVILSLALMWVLAACGGDETGEASPEAANPAQATPAPAQSEANTPTPPPAPTPWLLTPSVEFS